MFQFGIGGLYAKRTGGLAGTPDFPQRFGTLQDVNVEFNQKLVPLRGQSKFPDDVAPGDMECKGKAAFGNINVEIYNALFFADTITSGVTIVAFGDNGRGEAHTVPGTPFTVTVTNAATFVEDLGVRYADGSGELQAVAAGGEVFGRYSVDEDTGIYTFGSADEDAEVLISYAYTNTGGRTLTVTNRLMGQGPVFELFLLQPYQNIGNGMHLFRCRASKMSAPMKRDNYLISDFEFEAYTDDAGNVFEWFQTTGTVTTT